MSRISRLMFTLFALLPVISRIEAQALPSKEPRTPEWRLVARATHILQGTVMPAAADPEPDALSKYYLNFRIAQARALKGKITPSEPDVTVSAYTPIAPNLPAKIGSLYGKEVVVFARKVPGRSNRYDAHSEEPNAIMVSSPRLVASLKEELEHQARIAAFFPRSPAAKPDRYHSRVKAIIEKLHASPQQKAVDELDRMGAKAVPSLIRLMDDRRPLPKYYELLAFRHNPPPPGAPPIGPPTIPESHAYYRPPTVVDLVATVLTVITNEGFGSLHHGGTEEERQAEVRGWRVYLYYTQPKKR